MSITPIEVDLCLWSQINASSDVASWLLTDAGCLKDRVTMKLPPRCFSTHSPKVSASAPLTPIKQRTRAIYNSQTNSPTYSHGVFPLDLLLIFRVVINLFP